MSKLKTNKRLNHNSLDLRGGQDIAPQSHTAYTLGPLTALQINYSGLSGFDFKSFHVYASALAFLGSDELLS